MGGLLIKVALCCLQSTYCDNLKQHCDTVGRTIHIANLGEERNGLASGCSSLHYLLSPEHVHADTATAAAVAVAAAAA